MQLNKFIQKFNNIYLNILDPSEFKKVLIKKKKCGIYQIQH